MHRIRLAALGAGLACSLLIAPVGAAAARADAPTGGGMHASTASGSGPSCWEDAVSHDSLCVPAGEDLVTAVAEEKGVDLVLPSGTMVGDIRVTPADLAAARARSASVAPQSATVLSILYAGTGYSGASYVMSVAGGSCSTSAYGFTNLGSIGWNDRAQSYRSFSGCTTAVFRDINYGGTSSGYHTNESSLGSLNGQASSWRVSG